MITVNVRALDFMDARPLAAAELTVNLLVYPFFRVRPDPNDPEPDAPAMRELEGNPGLGKSVQDSKTTDAQGACTFTFDVDEFFVELKNAQSLDGRIAAAVKARVDVFAQFLGVRLDRFAILDELDNGADQAIVMPVDLGMSIVGHTTPTSTRLWFSLPFQPTSLQRFSCRLISDQELAPSATRRATAAAALGRTQAVTFDAASATAVVDFDALAPGTRHHYSLSLRKGRKDIVLAKGDFRTPSPTSMRLDFAFGSCHRPVVTGTPESPSDEALSSLERWQHLVDHADFEFLMLIGDQIYGDGIEDKWPNASPFEQYMRRYKQLWAHWPPREVMRTHPTYMVLDDHDVADDFGAGNLGDTKVAAALECYRHFQHARNPGGPGEPGGPFHYHFRWGPAAFFVMDGRTARGSGAPATPVFGHMQLQDLQAWVASDEVRNADVIFFVAPVPLALLPTETILAVAEELTQQGVAAAGALTGTLVGAVVGGILAGPFGAAAGAGIGAAVLGSVGYAVGEEVFEQWVEKSLLSAADLAERWDLDENRADLVRLLDILFGLANGLGDDPPRPRSVFVLSGDIHTGTMHAIRSLPVAAGADHRRNPLILQITSSALSHPPVRGDIYAQAVSHADADLDIDLHDMDLLTLLDERKDWGKLSAEDVGLDDIFQGGSGEYFLDSGDRKRYLCQFSGLLMERTVGRVRVELRDPATRRYRFAASVEGQQQVLETAFDLDLSAPRIRQIRDDAQFQTLTVPEEAVSGRRFAVTVRVRNTGVSTWRPGEHSLAVLDAVWGVDRIPLNVRVLPNRSHAFTFTLMGSTPGFLRARFQMSSRRARSVFGGVSPTRRVHIVGPEGELSCAQLAVQRKEAQERLDAARRQLHSEAEPSEATRRRVQAAVAALAAIDAERVRLGC
ncbi:alkaline phosphatase D family protein [Piscinibacter sp. XHJ-5]|uniref:alkaline phosphatase D family protein n=1 Tax=Piscinibacter sp. XHJ-5 TaxID=3037797 RepID=UPI0024528231|nr:alkaline phosphatase D family protein [Piscinibacter sp. XHJ-5]